MIETLLDELRSTGISFEDTGWSVAPGTDHGIVALEGGGEALWADDEMQEQAIRGAVHLFTADAGRGQMMAVQAALKRAGVGFRLSSIQYEANTRLTHYEWVFELEAM